MAHPLLWCAGMYPLLATGAASVANSLLESLGGMMSQKSTAAQRAAMRSAETDQVAAYRPPTQAEQIASLKTQLLNAPELQTALNTADPTHGATLGISTGGIVTYTGADGHVGALSLSPQTANLARQLSGMMGEAGQFGNNSMVALSGAGSVRTLSAFA